MLVSGGYRTAFKRQTQSFSQDSKQWLEEGGEGYLSLQAGILQCHQGTHSKTLQMSTSKDALTLPINDMAPVPDLCISPRRL